MSILYMLAGINHFVIPAFYLKIMPWYFPWPAHLVYLSGIAEFVLGVLILIQKTRFLAIWCIITMLLLFLSVHVQMIIDSFKNMDFIFWIAIARLPLQFVLIRWAYLLRNTGIRRQSTSSQY